MLHRLLIADDSPLYRLRLSQILAVSDSLQIIGLASDGSEAIRLFKERRAEALVLDLEMPGLDGIAVLRWVMRERPVPVVVCSGRNNVFEALEAGAVDFISKPELRHAIRSEEFAASLRQRVEEAARAHAHTIALSTPKGDSAVPLAARILANRNSQKKCPASASIIGIVGSAGSPAAVAALLSNLRADFTTPIVIALHMPKDFTRSFAARLSAARRFNVREARDEEKVLRKHIYVAPGGHHTTIYNDEAGAPRLRIAPAKAHDRHAPSANQLLRSLAETSGAGALGVVLTGMGDDGLEGARLMRERGGIVVTESRESALIWGMPRAVSEAGLADAEVDLQTIAALLPLLTNQ